MLLTGLASVQAVHAGSFSEPGAGIADTAAFEAALRRALSDPKISFGFSVHCSNEQSVRAARLYPSGAAVLDRKIQVRIRGEMRHEILEDFLSSGFTFFSSRYGGKSEKERSGGPLRVSCRIEATVDGLRKESAQLADGEQSEALLKLAASLLDRLESLTPGGIDAKSLEDGLAKIVEGILGPESLVIRLVHVPDKNNAKDGEILRVDSARWSWRSYRPGKAGSTATEWAPLPKGFEKSFANVAIREQFWALPINVPGAGHSEIEVRVLDHSKTVVSRNFTRIEPGTLQAEKDRFDAVADALRQLGQ